MSKAHVGEGSRGSLARVQRPGGPRAQSLGQEGSAKKKLKKNTAKWILPDPQNPPRFSLGVGGGYHRAPPNASNNPQSSWGGGS